MIISLLDLMKEKEFKKMGEKFIALPMRDNKLDHQESGLMKKVQESPSHGL